MPMPVRNTFVDFKTESNVPQLLTAPGKFVGRLAGFSSPTSSMVMSTATPTPSSRAVMALPTPSSTPMNGTRALSPVVETNVSAPAPSEKPALCLAQLVPSEPSRGVPVYTSAAPVMIAEVEAPRFAAPTIQPVLAPGAPIVAPMMAPTMMAPPIQAPVLPADASSLPFAPPKSPHLPPEFKNRAMPPPPTTQAMPTTQSPIRQQLEGGTLIEVKPLGEAVSPPQFAPPMYSINMPQAITPSGNSPPPLFTPSCATPGAGMANRFFAAAAPATASVGPDRKSVV